MEIMENWASVEHETRMGQSVSFFANKNVSQVYHSWLFTRSSSYYVKRNPENHKSGSQSLSDFGIFAVTLLEFPNSEKYGVPPWKWTKTKVWQDGEKCYMFDRTI